MQEIGIQVDSKDACRIFQDHGAKIDKKTQLVKIPETLVNEVLKKVPDSFSLYGPDEKVKVEVNTDNVTFATQGAPTRIYDYQNALMPRDATLKDFIKFLKIVDSLEYISCSHLDLWPVDIPYVTLHCHVIREWVKIVVSHSGLAAEGRSCQRI